MDFHYLLTLVFFSIFWKRSLKSEKEKNSVYGDGSMLTGPYVIGLKHKYKKILLRSSLLYIKNETGLSDLQLFLEN